MSLRLYDTDLTATAGAPVVTGTVKLGTTEVTSAKGGQALTLGLAITGTYTSLSASIRSGSLAGGVLTGAGPTWTLTAPYFDGPAQDDIVVDATVTYSGGTVPWTFVVTVYPHTSWYANAAGTTWLPSKGEVNL